MINETDYANNPLTLEQEKQIDAIFAQYDTIDKPGCSVGVIKNGRFIYKKSFGMADLENNIPINSDSKFDIGSVTKQFTATCVCLLAIEGKLSLDDNVRKYIPELPDYGHEITIHHLLNHTSGLRNYVNLMIFSGFKSYNNNDINSMIFKQSKLNFKPGEKCLYSNSNYQLAAEIVKRVACVSLSKYLTEKVLEPLDMNNSIIEESLNQIIPNRVFSYQEDEKGNLIRIVDTVDGHVGAKGLISTVNDLFKWDQNFYSAKVGGKELINLLTTKGEFEHIFGLISHSYKNLKAYSHSGSWMGFTSQIIRFPEQNTSVIILSNNNCWAITLAEKVTDVVLCDEISKLSKITDNSKISMIEADSLLKQVDLEKFCGYFWSEENLFNRKIYLKEGNLYYWRNEQSESRLIPISNNKLIMDLPGSEVEFIFHFDSCPISFNSYSEGKSTGIFTSYQPVKLTEEYFNQLTGNYYCDDLDVEYTLKFEPESILFYFKGNKLFDLNFKGELMQNYFLDNDGSLAIRFLSNDKNEILGFLMKEEFTDMVLSFVKKD
jgi:CubicO group peptidase (beta-lactamase class C family)